MDRVVALLGLMVFTVGVAALASAHRKAVSHQPRLPERPAPRPPVLHLTGPSYHMPLSLN